MSQQPPTQPPAPSPAPSGEWQAPPPQPAGQNPLKPPQWFWAAALLLGVPVSGGLGGAFGSGQATEGIARVEAKMERVESTIEKADDKQEDLDKKIDALTILIIRAHPDISLD